MADDKHSGARHAVDKATDAVGGAVGKAAAATAGSHNTVSFVTNAVQSDHYEIEASEVALRRAQSPKVRELAQEMIDDHRKSSSRLDSILAGNTDVSRPEHPIDQRRKGMVEHLEKAPDDKFDQAYLDQQLAAHEEATTLFRGYADKGDNAELKSFAAEVLPTLERHLEHVRSVHG